jgi:hypothetical protein
LGKASRGKASAKRIGQTKDHTVSQMYLRRFGEHTGPRQYKLTVRRIDQVDQPFHATPINVLAERGYYWGTTFDGVPHHKVEDLFTKLETDTATVLRAVLDAPEGALPERWPLSEPERLMLSWWLAAQILRTTRQRKRLTFTAPEAERLEAPTEIVTIAANNPHLSFIVERLSALAFTLYARPWGLGFSEMCLLTSDVPVTLFNHHDAENQLAAAALSDILIPLDPHRLLFMPSPRMQADDPSKRADHRMKIPGAIGMALVQIAYDVADAYVIHHPRHDPWAHWAPTGPRQPTPWNGTNHSAPTYVLDYATMAPHLTVERRWLTEHP